MTRALETYEAWDAPAVEPPPASAGFLAGLVIAQAGAFLSFLPLLQILLPLKAEAVSGARHVQVLSAVTAVAALAGGLANLAAGYLSDRARSRFGRRRPWILAGLAALLASYAAIWRAATPLALGAALIGFQIALNVMFAPLVAVTPDRIPVRQRGRAAGLLALGQPLGLMVGGVAIGGLIVSEPARYAALGALVAAAIGPFALRLRDVPIAEPAAGPAPAARRKATLRNFWLAFAARTLVACALIVAQTYLLYFLQDAQRFARFGLARPEAGVARLGVVFGLVTCAAALLAGRLSDLQARRRVFVIAGALAAATGLATLAFAPGWPAALAAYALFAAGAGCHTAVDFALMTELLPSRNRVARDLGVLNFSNIAPQVVAPLAAAGLMTLPGMDIRGVLLAGAACAALGALTSLAMRGVR